MCIRDSWRAAALDDRLGPRLGSSFDHLLVDEYQDVNGLQVDILKALRRTDERITIVGDDAQAVYSFRAAQPRHILDFEQIFPGARTVVLNTNYRSGQQILDLANSVAAEAPEGFSAVLRAANGQAGMRPRLVRCADEDAQVSAVCAQLLAHREEGIALKEQAVLVRAAHHSNLLELELGSRRVPYVKYGGCLLYTSMIPLVAPKMDLCGFLRRRGLIRLSGRPTRASKRRVNGGHHDVCHDRDSLRTSWRWTHDETTDRPRWRNERQ